MLGQHEHRYRARPAREQHLFRVESQHLKEQLFHAKKYRVFWSLNVSMGSKSLLITDSEAHYKLKAPTWGVSRLCWPQVRAISITASARCQVRALPLMLAAG